MALFALFYLGHFITFIIIGPVTVGEANKFVLWGEMVLLVSIAVLAMDCFIGDLKNKEGKERFKLKDRSN